MAAAAAAAAAGGAPAGMRSAPEGQLLVLIEGGASTLLDLPPAGSRIVMLQRQVSADTAIPVARVLLFATDERNAPTGAALLPEAPFRADVFQHGVVYVRDAAAAGEWL